MLETINYPATYQAPIIRRMIAVFHMIIVLGLAIFGRGQMDSSSSKAIWAIVITGLIVAIILKYDDVSSYITLYPDHIEKKSILIKRICRRNEVVGFWADSFGGFCLVRKYNIKGYFIVPAGIKRDATWRDWLRDAPEISKYSTSNKGKTLTIAIICIGFGTLVLLMGFMSFINFKELRIVDAGPIVRAKISTVQDGKNTASGWIDYNISNGTTCHDWIELAPNGSVRPGDDINVAIDRVCGHSVSTKKPLYPWLFLTMAVGIFIAMIYQLFKFNKHTVPKRHIR